ncbi:hypothetical protein MATL_G00038170 [Megalops atlanticus]|uniref:Uncharacterized protein n=1 Tax=Megalops atlanticus TaxID=7932 RepID=A0A9D3TKH0_MEGAT|nr:hypothetical protein MATL_G00038170 [Megalops atlanticus]
MGNACCFPTGICEVQVDGKKGLLPDSNEGSSAVVKASEDEPHRKLTGFLEKEEGVKANANSTLESSTKPGSDAQLDTRATAAQLKQDVFAEVRDMDTAHTSPKSEDGSTPNLTPETEEQKLLDVTSKVENGHDEDPFLKTEDICVESLSKAQDLKTEGSLLKTSSSNTEDMQIEDPSLKTKSVETEVPSLKTESVQDEDPSLKTEYVRVEDLSHKTKCVQEENSLSKILDIKDEDKPPTTVNGPAEDPSLLYEPRVGKSSPSHEPQTDTHPTEDARDQPSQFDQKTSLEIHYSPAHGEDAEVMSASLVLDGKPEHMGRDSESSSQAETHKPEDQLTARKSDTTEEEKVEDPVSRIVGLSEVPSLEDIVQEVEEKTAEDVGEEEEEWDTSKSSPKGEKVEQASSTETKAQSQEECNNQDSPLFVEVKVEPMEREHDTFGEEQDDSNYDLYRGADEIAKERREQKKVEPLIQITLPGVQDKSSVAPAVDILSYSQREWKGNTAKSTLIRKGYTELSRTFGDVRRVRGDNYCALRATLFQVLSQSNKLPAWLQEDDITLLPEKLVTEEDLIEGWRFPLEQREEAKTGGAVEQLKHCLQLLQKRWRAAAKAGSEEERRRLCEEVFQGGEEEYALLEALKLLMLSSATELHARMRRNDDVPIFCWLLFARDSSTCPRTFLTNHLSHVGFSGGLEQVEMFLLGYTLQQTIQVYRLYMADTEEFITYYPDDHKEDWPHVCLVTEDDRHYNVPVGKPVGLNSQNPPQ